MARTKEILKANKQTTQLRKDHVRRFVRYRVISHTERVSSKNEKEEKKNRLTYPLVDVNTLSENL